MELIILSGIQCAGKSTFYNQKFANTHTRINLDTLQTRKNEMIAFTSLIDSRLPVVVDNTNPAKEDRARYIGLAKFQGYRVIGYQFDVSLAIALKRSAKRIDQKKVPDFVVRITASKMSCLAIEEGFDKIFIVGNSGEIL